MAKETKSLELANSAVASTVRQYEMFGWEVLSQQRVYHKSQEITGRDAHRTSFTTTTVDFMQVTLQRDKSMPNYFEIAELEEEYFNCIKRGNLLRSSIKLNPSFNFIAFILLGLCTAGIGAGLYLIYFIAKYFLSKGKINEHNKKSFEKISEADARIKEIEKEVSGLV